MKTYQCSKCPAVFSDSHALGGHSNIHRARTAAQPASKSFSDEAEEIYHKFRTYINKLEEENARLRKLLAKWEELAGRLVESNNIGARK